MGWLKKITKGVKNVFKGVNKVIKGVTRGVSNFLKSDFGKALLVAGAIYVGYGLATQGTSFFTGAEAAGASAQTASTAGAITPSAETAAQTAAGAAGGGAVGEGAVLAPSAAAGGSAGVGGSVAPASFAEVAPNTSQALVSGSIGQPVGTGTVLAAGGGVPEVTAVPEPPGFFSGDLAKYGAIQVGGNMVSSAFTPNPTDEQIRLEQARQKAGRIAGYGGVGGGGPVRIGNRTYS